MNNFTISDISRLADYSLLEHPTGNTWLDARYQEQVSIVGHTQPYYRLFYQLAQILKPDFVVELGSWQATAAAHFALGNPEATVITIDIHKDDKDAQRRAIEAADYIPNLTYINSWTWDALNITWVMEFFNKKIDILFIDAWHDYEYVKREWDLYSPLLSSPALVICDDITTAHNFDGMIKFWEELPGEKFLSHDVHRPIPMGFLRYVDPNRESNPTEPTADPRPATRKRGRKPRAA